MLTTTLLMMLNYAGFLVAPPVMEATSDLVPAGGPVIMAVGIGRSPGRYKGARARLMAERAAQVVAARNLLAKVSQTEMPHRGTGRIRVEGRLAGIRYLPTVFHPDGSAEVVAEVTLRGR